MRIARNIAGYEFGLLIGFVASGYIGAWWLLLAVAFLAGFIWLDARIRDADFERGTRWRKMGNWIEGHTEGYYVGYGKGFNDALQKRAPFAGREG